MNSNKQQTSQRLLRHSHTCKACGEAYDHMHPAMSGDHQQFDFQCPNSSCAMFLGKATNPKTRPPTWDADGVEVQWPTGKVVGVESGPKRTFRTNKEKTVVLSYERGLLNCPNPDHYRMVKKEGSQYLDPVLRPSVEILRDMEPYTKAACPCERKACRDAWSMNRPGPLQTEWVQNGCYSKGVGTVTGGTPKTVMPLSFRLTSAQFAELHERFPDYHFVQVKNDGHDHPISHAITQVASYEMMRGFKNTGKKIFDIHGNPALNDQIRKELGLDLTTGVRLETGKDYVRAATKWSGSSYVEMPDLRDITNADMPDNNGCAALLKETQAIVSTHSGYYYMMPEIVSLLQGCKEKATMTLIMHRFKGESGTINSGELSWKRNGGSIEQVNVSTGETYRHPDNAQWFERDAWCAADPTDPKFNASKGELGSLAWTKTEVTPGTYRLLVTLCSHNAAWLELGGDMSRPKFKVNEVVVASSFSVKKFALPETHTKLFEDCLSQIAGKPRTEKQWTAHLASCKSKVKVLAGDKHSPAQTSAELLHAIALASFWRDSAGQAFDAMEFTASNQFITRQHEKTVNGTSVLKNGNFIKLALDIISHVSDSPETKKWVKGVDMLHTAIY
jgi:hypothetical protein